MSRVRGGLPLTAQETMVFEQLMLGKSDKEIAGALGMGNKTVKYHLCGVREALHGSGKGERWWLLVARERGRIEGRKAAAVSA